MSLDVYDIRGRRVRTLMRGKPSQGTHVVTWDGADSGGGSAARGIYFARFTAGTTRHARQFVLQ